MDYYSILQIKENATQDEIKHAYYKMARLFHPDNFNGSVSMAEEQMGKINEAYEVLSDVEKRRLYDTNRKLDKEKDYRRENDKNENVSPNTFTNKNSKDEDAETKINTDNTLNRGCSSCLSKIIEWAIYIGIICFIAGRLNLDDKVESLFEKANISQFTNNGNEEDLLELNPDEVVVSYFDCLREGELTNANKLFTEKADDNFQPSTVSKYNQTIIGLYYEIEQDVPTYPLFEEIRKFNYSIKKVEIDESQNRAEVKVKLENCDIALLFGLILESDSENVLASLTDSECQKLFRKAIKQQKDVCMISTKATFVLKKDKEGVWKISKISPRKDFWKVIIGQADDLVLALSGEENSSDISEADESGDEYPDYEEDPYAEDILP